MCLSHRCQRRDAAWHFEISHRDCDLRGLAPDVITTDPCTKVLDLRMQPPQTCDMTLGSERIICGLREGAMNVFYWLNVYSAFVILRGEKTMDVFDVLDRCHDVEPNGNPSPALTRFIAKLQLGRVLYHPMHFRSIRRSLKDHGPFLLDLLHVSKAPYQPPKASPKCVHLPAQKFLLTLSFLASSLLTCSCAFSVRFSISLLCFFTSSLSFSLEGGFSFRILGCAPLLPDLLAPSLDCDCWPGSTLD